MAKETEKSKGRTKRVHIFVIGHVQGVGYRFSVVSLAKSLGLQGWVKNLLDGGVEILAEGKGASIEKFITRVKQGHPNAQIENVRVEYEIPTGENWGFEIMY